MSDLFDRTTRALGSAANFRQMRHNVISSNVANADTPGYQAKKLEFEDSLARAIRTEASGAEPTAVETGHFATGPGAISRTQADVFENPDAEPVGLDGNTVNVEREMAGLVENSIMYKAAIQLINKKLAALKYAANDGR
ncbi:MAG TPA: flagellar basal body rod protein FlgB [Pseudobdellovibrionaceae bacterium]|nr:flagellar basal body rod protein FlgB [Pseudobdellovibrionaceae bacterium]